MLAPVTSPTRDRGWPFRLFFRLYDELVPVLDMVGMVEAEAGTGQAVSCAGHLLGRTADSFGPILSELCVAAMLDEEGTASPRSMAARQPPC